ncbi:hypothetical protein [Virgibacillus salinus]|uniref:Uncharacterized protein n=1 Tax=Virgibacillus salinus TaxID=553311 RepID=A0A1H0XUU4_9BACI|nr:hypothetical protein [Virgibacillus salinus]SDQ06653.1 hypothetical protein SAMN05216231_0223 [Virgibacillus salinus]
MIDATKLLTSFRIKNHSKETNVIYDPFFSNEPLGTGYFIDEIALEIRSPNSQLIDEIEPALNDCPTVKMAIYDSQTATFSCNAAEDRECNYPHEVESMVVSVCQPVHNALENYPYSYQLYAKLGFFND